MTSPTGSSGTDERDEHDRLEQHRAGGLQRLAHGDRAGHLERHLGRVDRVVGAVEEAHAHALDREAGHRAVLHAPRRTPFSTAGMKPVGITPPLIALTNSKPCRRSSGSISMWQSPNCPRPPVCFLWRPCALAGRADRLLVGHARRLERHLGAEARLQAVDDDLDVDLREPGDDLLAGLRVAMQVDRRVLLLQAAQRGEDLVLVALGLGLDREGHDRLRELDGGHRDRLVAGGQPVAGARLLELGHRADVAGAEAVGVPLAPCPPARAGSRCAPWRARAC